jgi:hypothetical protein
MFGLNLDVETGRILSACYILENNDYTGIPIVETLPEGDISEYLYVNGEYIHSPLPVEPVIPKPTQLDVIEAQVMYTAMMTDTMLEV